MSENPFGRIDFKDVKSLWKYMKNPSGNSGSRAQSAIEYLMTYGWAILIIAVVLGALFGLGFFNSASLAPKAPPGSCIVERPYGPGSSAYASLQGTCNNQLPEYVLRSVGKSGGFVFVPYSNAYLNPLNIQGQHITVTAWVYLFGKPFHDILDKEGQYGLKLNYQNSPVPCKPDQNPLEAGSSSSNGLCLEWDTAGNWTGQSYPIPGGGFNQWIFLAASVNGNDKYWYANGKQIGGEASGNAVQLVYSNATLTIGAISQYGPVNSITGNAIYTGYAGNELFNGTISNVQIYNSTLSPTEISNLYHEGIGGVPISVGSIVGWWPLNGNANDYSGNDNNGAPVNMIFTNSWTSYYTAP